MVGARPGEPDRRAHRLQRRVRAAAGAGAGGGRGRPGRRRPGAAGALGQQEGTVEVALADIAPGAVSGWAAYVAGVAWALREAGHDVPGLDVVVDGDIPSGAGLSSSAALECAVAVALERARRAGPVPARPRRGHPAGRERRRRRPDRRSWTRWPRSTAAPVTCVFLDMRTLEAEQVPFDLAAAGLALVVVDTRAPHAHVDGEYAERRRSCEQAARDPRRAGAARRHRRRPRRRAGPARRRCRGDLLRKRVRHIVTENARVLDGRRARCGPATTRARSARRSPPRTPRCATTSRSPFRRSTPPCRRRWTPARYGARMTGGGFGGCVLALVEADAVEPVVRAVEAAYEAAGFWPPAAFVAAAADGARRL